MKKVLLIVLSLLFALTAISCVKEKNVITLDFDGTTSAIFSSSTDKMLLPIKGDVPTANEMIEKTVRVKFSNAGKIALSFESEDDIINGLMLSVNGDEGKPFAIGIFYERDVVKTDKAFEITVSVWLNKEALPDVAGKTYNFKIIAMAA